MYRILIVEDEKIERDHLVSVISSFDFPIEKVLTASNGAEGLEVFEEARPHIVIADINMPIVSGLQMIEEIKRRNPQVICYILSSYDYFSYAQKAMRLGVEDFILKPSNRTTIHAIITRSLEQMRLRENEKEQEIKLIQKMNDLNEKIVKNIFYIIMTLADGTKIKENLKLLGVEAANGICLLIDELYEYKIDQVRQVIDDCGYFSIANMVENYGVIFVFSNYEFNEKSIEPLKDLIEQTFIKTKCYLGRCVSNLAELKKSYGDAKAKCMIANASNEPHREININGLVRQLLDLIEVKDQQQIEVGVRHIVWLFDMKTVSSDNAFITELEKEFYQRYDMKLEYHMLKESFKEIQSSAELEKWLMNIYEEITKMLSSTKYARYQTLYRNAIAFIDENYHKPITLITVADALNITPFYLSRVINTHGDETFTDMVNMRRIEKAKQLIKEDVPFKEIAYEVGFTSQSYFTKMFRKLCGVLPSEYKKQYDAS